MKISCKALHEAEADWSCRGCGKPIKGDEKAIVMFRAADMGAVVVHVPLRVHRSCQKLGIRHGVGARA